MFAQAALMGRGQGRLPPQALLHCHAGVRGGLVHTHTYHSGNKGASSLSGDWGFPHEVVLVMGSWLTVVRVEVAELYEHPSGRTVGGQEMVV